jgi:aminopeptidase N
VDRDHARTVVRRSDYRPPAFLVDRIELELDLDPARTCVRSRLEFRRNPAAGGDALVLQGEQQQDVAVALDGRTLPDSAFALADGALTIAQAPEHGVLQVTSVIDPAANTALEGLYLSSGVFCTQCEPEGFRRITFFPDRPDVLSRYRVRIVADRDLCPVLLSNGNLVASETLDGNRHAATWDDPFPKPSYLFALVAGDLASLDGGFVTRSGRHVRLRIYSTPRNLPRCRHAMESLQRAMRWDEERFGLEYDLDTFMIFSADDFNFGAMENKGLNIFNSKLLLASPETATDADYQRIESVIGHEYFHNWTGNRVTCRDWFQLSLKEGLTVFRDQEFSADMGSRAAHRTRAIERLRNAQFPEDAGPMAHPVRPESYVEINNFYTPTVYEKGAEVIRMQHGLLGEEAFRRGMDLYFERHDGHAVTCDDFVQAMQDASGVDLEQFRLWYGQAGTPTLAVRGEHDAAGETYTLHVEQSCPPTPGQPTKSPLLVPLAVGLVGPDGRNLPLRLVGEPPAERAATTRVLHVRHAAESFRFAGVKEPPAPSLLRGFSAPVKVEYAYTAAELARLATHDGDHVARWDAAQRLFVDAILAAGRDWRADAPAALEPAVITVARALLADGATDPALRALALHLPEIGYLVESTTPIDLDALLAGRDAVEGSLAQSLRAELAAAYDALAVDAAYAPTAAQIARRSLRNACLGLLGRLDDDDARARCVAQYRRAGNMTDTVAALVAINDSAGEEREILSAEFASRWAHEPLVLDKWFALEASTARPDALERVRARMRHPAFDARNPNRVYALIGTFAMANWRRFHDRTGEAYRFLADEVLALDRTNPMVAARLVGAFNRWARFDSERSALQRAELERIARVDDVSGNVREIVTKALA